MDGHCRCLRRGADAEGGGLMRWWNIQAAGLGTIMVKAQTRIQALEEAADRWKVDVDKLADAKVEPGKNCDAPGVHGQGGRRGPDGAGAGPP